MWFGTRQFMREIADPQANPEYPRTGWESEQEFYRGAVAIDQSVDGHQSWFFDWGILTAEETRKITDFRDGVYGPPIIQWTDPVSSRANALKQSWATPSLAGYDAVPLAGDDRPALSANTDQSRGYPVEKATYTLTAETVLKSMFVPIPPGHVAWVGVHGEANAAGRVKVTPFTGSTPGTVIHPTILSVSTATRVNTEVEGTGLELSLDNSSPGACTLTGMIVQILRDGEVPATGDFISGQGHGPCRFKGRPNRTPFIATPEDTRMRVSATLVEVG